MASPTPASFLAMLDAWNEPDPAKVRSMAESALMPDIEFVDPHYNTRGIEAWLAMVAEFHVKYGEARIQRISAIDCHNDRARYAWAVVWPDGRRAEGFDASAFDAATGKVRRVDGFFGPLKPA